MKNNFRNWICLGLLIFLFACADSPPQKTDLYIYLDYTEGQDYSQQLAADADQLVELMNVTEGNDRNYGTVRLYPIHDVGATGSKVVKLKEGKSKLEGNKYLRKKELDTFKEQLLGKIETLNEQYSGKALNHSHIFLPLCKGVKKLNRSDAQRKLIVLYSDLLENSELANLHAHKTNTTALSTLFDQACELGDLSDFELYVVHPIDKKNDQKIRKAGTFWEQYFVSKGLDTEAFHFDTGLDL